MKIKKNEKGSFLIFQDRQVFIAMVKCALWLHDIFVLKLQVGFMSSLQLTRHIILIFV